MGWDVVWYVLLCLCVLCASRVQPFRTGAGVGVQDGLLPLEQRRDGGRLFDDDSIASRVVLVGVCVWNVCLWLMRNPSPPCTITIIPWHGV